MTTPDALLAAILADPDDDTVRLVYADAIEEAGQAERAEFIRVQIELSRLGLGVKKLLCEPGETLEQGVGRMVADSKRIDPEHAAKLKDRERELVSGFNGDRAACCPVAFPGIRLVGLDLGWYSGQNVLGELRRGFVEQVTCTAEDWFRHAAAITASHPIREVTLTTVPYDDGNFLAPRGWWDELSVKAWPRITFTLPPEPTLDGTRLVSGGRFVLAAPDA